MGQGYPNKSGRGALVLTCGVTERLELATEHGEEITIEVVRIKGSHVRLRTIADRSVRIVRGEVADRDARRTRAREALLGNQAGGVPAIASDSRPAA